MEKSLIFICVLFAIAYGCQPDLVVDEGEIATIKFQFPYVDVDITLQFEDESPFYNNGVFVESELDRYDRFNRYSLNYDVMGKPNLLIFNFVITDVRREDSKVIECDAYRNGILLESQLIKIRVSFPPSDTSCTFDLSDNRFTYLGDLWVMLTCTAFLGNIPANILCYQDGKSVPPFELMSTSETNMTQKVWVTKTALVSCCSSTYKNPVDMHSCTDFKWEPRTYTRDDTQMPRDENPTPSLDSANLLPTCNMDDLITRIEDINATLIALTFVIFVMTALLIICVVFFGKKMSK